MLGFSYLADLIWWVFGLEGVQRTDRPVILPSAKHYRPGRSDVQYSDGRRKEPRNHTWRRPTLPTVPEATHSAASEWGGAQANRAPTYGTSAQATQIQPQRTNPWAEEGDELARVYFSDEQVLNSKSTQAPEKGIATGTRAGFHKFPRPWDPPTVSSAEEEEDDKYATFGDISPKQAAQYRYRGSERTSPLPKEADKDEGVAQEEYEAGGFDEKEDEGMSNDPRAVHWLDDLGVLDYLI